MKTYIDKLKATLHDLWHYLNDIGQTAPPYFYGSGSVSTALAPWG